MQILLSILMGVFKVIGKALLKILVFTGLWWTIIIFYISTKIESTYFPNLYTENHSLYVVWDIGFMGVVGLLPPLFVTIQNIVRLLSRNPSFSLFGLITGHSRNKKDRKITAPTAPAELTAGKPQGVIFGRSKGKYVVKPEETDGHILVAGGAGSGKSSCIGIPTLQSWGQRVFAIDIKGELYQKTAGKRLNTKVFNPSDEMAYGYNPFYMLSESENLAQDMRDIALAIVPTPPNVKEPFWVESAQNLFTGGLLHFYNKGYGFIESIEKIQSTPSAQLVDEIMKSDFDLARFYVAQFVGIDEKTLSGVMTELSNKIMVFATDKSIRKALSKGNVITPQDLEQGTDIYVCIEESKLEQWKSLLTLMVNQFLKHFEKRTEGENERVLFLLDEFARLGKIEAIINGLATLRSKGITIMPIIQSQAQLDLIYGKEARQVIMDNCAYKAILSATDADTQETFSRLVGTYDKYKKSRNASFEQYTGMGRGKGINETTEEKRIIKPEQFGTLTDIILLSPYGFMRVEKTSCYKCKEFAPTPPQVIVHHSNVGAVTQ